MTRNTGHRLPDSYKTDKERRDQARAELRQVDAEKAVAVSRGADVDYGPIDLASPGVAAALAFDHAHGVKHRGLPCCAPRPAAQGER